MTPTTSTTPPPPPPSATCPPRPADRSVYCRRCFYILSGVRGSQCPECGEPFSFADSATFLRTPISKSKRRFDRIIPYALMLFGAVNLVCFGWVALHAANGAFNFIRFGSRTLYTNPVTWLLIFLINGVLATGLAMVCVRRPTARSGRT